MTSPLPLPALHALLDLAAGDSALVPRIAPDDWSLLLDVAEGAAVAPRVDAEILRRTTLKPAESIPRDVLDRVRARAADAAAAASAWHADLLAAAVATQQIGVVPIALKGAALVAHCIIRPGERHMHDIDLLVPDDRATDASAALVEHGFALPAGDATPGVDGLPRDASRWRDPHIAFHAVGPFGTPIEVHRIASRVSGGTWSELAMFSVPARLGDASVLVPTVHRLRRMLDEHVFLSHLADPRLLLRHAADLAAIERWADRRVPAAPAALARADRLAERALMALVRARAPDASPVTAAQRLLLSRDGANAERVERIWHRLEAAEVAFHDLRHRPTLLLRRVAPHPAYLASLYDVPIDEAATLRMQLRRWRDLRTGLGGRRRRE